MNLNPLSQAVCSANYRIPTPLEIFVYAPITKDIIAKDITWLSKIGRFPKEKN